jgi:3-hydroxyacyl-[acyl-carrier-protein] dehydratase
MSTNPEAISTDIPDKRQDVPLDVRAIQALLPHRFPFLLLDRVIEIEQGKRAVAIKNVTVSEPFFQGHFPNVPIMPGVLIIEAMAQLGGVLLMQMAPADGKEKLALLTGVDKVRFRRKVVPGDQLRLEAEILKIHGVMGKIRTSAHVDGQLVSEGELLFCLAEPD